MSVAVARALETGLGLPRAPLPHFEAMMYLPNFAGPHLPRYEHHDQARAAEREDEYGCTMHHNNLTSRKVSLLARGQMAANFLHQNCTVPLVVCRWKGITTPGHRAIHGIEAKRVTSLEN
jgi:hypothetical protein